jgi:hypothetical protein
MDQCTGRAGHSDGVGAGLCALLAAAPRPCTAAISPPPPREASKWDSARGVKLYACTIANGFSYRN